MYLYVFVLLMVGILGLFTEIFSLQVGRMAARQTAAAQDMITWQVTAASPYQNNTLPNYNATDGAAGNDCSLTPAPPAGMPAACLVTILPGVAASGAPGQLPLGYAANMKWKSIIYTPTGLNKRYVITYAEPPAAPATALDPIAFPNIGISVGELLRQVVSLRVSLTSFGTVVGGQIQTSFGTNLPPPLTGLAEGSVVLITQP